MAQLIWWGAHSPSAPWFLYMPIERTTISLCTNYSARTGTFMSKALWGFNRTLPLSDLLKGSLKDEIVGWPEELS